MSKLHIANINFEWELTQKTPPTLASTFEMHKVFLQLQFLPFLYAEANDGIMLSHPPPETFDTKGIAWHLFSDQDLKRYDSIESWGHSKSIECWAKEKRIPYSVPPWNVTEKVASKAFSFQQTPQIPGSKLLTSKNEVNDFLKRGAFPKVFKSCYGFAGRGLYRVKEAQIEKYPALIKFLESEWREKRPVIGQDWVEKVIDFSSQWYITKDGKIDYLGPTMNENTHAGGYLSSTVAEKKALFGTFLPFLEQHLKITHPLMKKIASMGYSGHLGVDSMVYDQSQLYPVVEINPRKTMGYLALKLLKMHPSSSFLNLTYSSNIEGDHLPSYLGNIQFSKHLSIDLHPLQL